MDRIDEILEKYREEMMETVQKWVRIPSVKDEPASGAPFGIEARRALNAADVILAKGQGNYESLCGQGWHVFYAFLCKCELFTSRFRVPALTGMLVEEAGA